MLHLKVRETDYEDENAPENDEKTHLIPLIVLYGDAPQVSGL